MPRRTKNHRVQAYCLKCKWNTKGTASWYGSLEDANEAIARHVETPEHAAHSRSS